MKKEILQNISRETEKVTGKVKGEAIVTLAKFIEKKEGKGMIKKVEKEMKELGYDFSFKKINTFQWIDMKIDVLSLLIAREIFNWSDSDIIERGKFHFTVSFLTKMFFFSFVSPKSIFQYVASYWSKYYNEGEVERVEFNEKEKYMILRVRNFYGHPILCLRHQGYVLGLMELVVGKDSNIKTEERACKCRGDDYHELFVMWS